MKYIQSYYPYAITFSSIDLAVPSKDAEGPLRNICEIPEDKLSVLQEQEPLFRALVNQKKYRVLNHLPEHYKPAATLVNEARSEAAAAKKENEELKAKLEALENEKKAVEKPKSKKTVKTETEASEPKED